MADCLAVCEIERGFWVVWEALLGLVIVEEIVEEVDDEKLLLLGLEVGSNGEEGEKEAVGMGGEDWVRKMG